MWNRNFIMVIAGQIISLFGNAAINLVSSFAGLIGPVIGGALFGFYGIMPVLYACMFCFLLSAIMEIFIQIPFEKKPAEGNVFAIGFGDLRESFHYIYREQPLIMQFSLAVAAINMVLSSLVIIGLPVIITQMLEFDSETANRLYGYAESVFAMGSLCGGMGASPIGQAIYGGLFEGFREGVFAVFFAAALLTVMLALSLKKGFQKLEGLLV